MKNFLKLTLGYTALIVATFILIAWYCVYSNNVYQQHYYDGHKELYLYK